MNRKNNVFVLFKKIDNYKKMHNKISKYKQRIFELRDKNKKLSCQLAVLVDENENMQERICYLEKQIEKNLAVSNINNEVNIKAEKKNLDGEFNKCTKIYNRLYEAMAQSNILRELMEKFSINFDNNDNEISNMICFVRMIGNGVTFADVLYIFLEQKCVVLGHKEKLFVDELNKFYRNIYAIHYDVVIFPNYDLDKKFNKMLMKDNTRRSEIFKFYSDVFVPAVMRNSKNVEKRAIVNGHN